MFNLFNSRHPQTFSNIFPTSSDSGGDMELLDVIYVKWSLPGTTSIFPITVMVKSILSA